MKHLPSAMLRRLRRSPRGVLIARIVRGTLYVKLGLALVLGLVTGLLYLRLSSGPLSFEGLSERVAAAIASRIGPGWTVALTTSAIELEDGALALRTAGLDIRNPDGLSVVRSPHAIVSVDTVGLMTGSLQPRSIEFRDLQVRAALNRDGSLTFVAAEGSEPQPGPPPAAPPSGAPPAASAPGPDASAVSSALASLFDLVLEPRGVVGALDRARIGNARLTLVDSDGRDRASFEHVRAMFERNGSDGRRFELQVDGSDGGWRIEGDLRTGGSGAREGTIKATGIPVADILLLSGRSKFPATTDVKLAVEANAALRNGRLPRLDARLATSSGILQIDDKDMPPIDVESASAEAVWDEPRRTLGLANVTFKSGRTDVRLRGEVAPTPESGWRLTASGRNASIRGPQAEDPAFAIDNIEGALKTVEGGLELEKLALQGPTLNVALTGAFGTLSDPMALRVKGRATRTDVRTALRLWPNAVVPNLRNYLVENLRAGTVEAVDLAVAMSGRDLIDATGVGPIPDDAVKIEFAIKSGELRVTEGLPPLSDISATGAATGTTATVTVPTAQVQMPEGRTLSLSDGSFRLPKIWSREAQASVTFKLEGGADGLGALLQAPLLQGMASVDLDPAAIKGRTDLRVTLGLPLKNMPKIANLPIAISGGIGGLTIDRAFGKERLENANLSVGYDRGNLGIRGEGKLWGVPASIDVRQQRNAAGEAVVSFTLDEAARARKGIGFGSQLAGPVPIRVALPLGKGAKPGAKIEADLTKAVVDNLVPGWVKPAGKPGKLSFLAATAAAPNGSSELREFTLDSGTAQMRGTLTLSAEGQLDRADLSSFKLSPGDDLKVLVERTGTIYHASIRGPVADA